MTRVHAFKIAKVDSGTWLYTNEPFCRVSGYLPKMIVQLPLEAFEHRCPEPGDHVIVWPHGLITIRTPATFEKDFTHVSGTVYETPCEALFQRGMLSPEYREQVKKERAERKYPGPTAEDIERIREANEASVRNARDNPGACIVRRIIPGLLPAPSGGVQPLSPVISLPVLSTPPL